MQDKMNNKNNKNNKVIEAILSRRSIREFKAKPVSKDKISSLLDAARWAPSGLNNQPWRFIVIQEKERILKLSQCTHYTKVIAEAPLLIAVYLDKTQAYSHTKDIQAIGASIQNMLLACGELGLGAVWLGEILKQAKKVNSILECPKTFELMALLAIGEPLPKARSSSRKELKELVFEEKFGKLWKD